MAADEMAGGGENDEPGACGLSCAISVRLVRTQPVSTATSLVSPVVEVLHPRTMLVPLMQQRSFDYCRHLQCSRQWLSLWQLVRAPR